MNTINDIIKDLFAFYGIMVENEAYAVKLYTVNNVDNDDNDDNDDNNDDKE
jgi:hypothetical protein